MREMKATRSIARVVSAAGLVVTCGLLGACGSSASAPPAYLAAGNAICATQLAQLNKLAQPTTPEGAVTYLPKAIAIMTREADQLSSIRPLASTHEAFQAALAGTRQLAGALAQFLHQLRAGIVELSTFSHIQTTSTALTAQINAHFRQAGFARCAQ
jgi:hypothetical protein